MDDFIDLSIGNVLTTLPESVINKSMGYLAKTFPYSDPAGTERLRKVIAKKLSNKDKGRLISELDVVITTGASMALTSILISQFSRGDKILVPNICYPGIKNTINYLGMDAVNYNIEEEINPFSNHEAFSAKAIIVNSPLNPTGRVLNKDEINKIITDAEKFNCTIISDEVYDDFIYANDTSDGLTSDSIKVFRIRSFSKCFGLSGLRVGVIILPSHELARSISRVHFSLAMSAPLLSQEIIADVLEYHDVNKWVSSIKNNVFNNMTKTKNKLSDTSFLIKEIDGGIFSWIDVSSLNVSATDFSDLLMYKSKIMVSPESVFNQNRDTHIRINLSGEWKHIDFAINEMINAANLINRIKR